MNFRDSIKKPFSLVPPSKIIVDIQGGLQDILAVYSANRIIQKQSLKTEIIGITCVTGRHTLEDAAKSALAANYLMDKKIPIYLGQSESLLLRKEYPDTYVSANYSELENILFHKSQPLKQFCIQEMKATDYLMQSTKKYGSELGIVAFGPLTNLGLVQSLQESFNDIKLISVNGGQYTGIGTTTQGNVEPNFAFDPLAVHILFESPLLKNKIYVNPVEKTLKHDWKKTFQRCYNQCELKEDRKALIKILVEGSHEFMLWGPFLTILPVICPQFVKYHHHVYAEIVRDAENVDGLMAINWLKVGAKQGEFPDKVFIYEDFDQEQIQELLLKVYNV